MTVEFWNSTWGSTKGVISCSLDFGMISGSLGAVMRIFRSRCSPGPILQRGRGLLLRMSAVVEPALVATDAADEVAELTVLAWGRWWLLQSRPPPRSMILSSSSDRSSSTAVCNTNTHSSDGFPRLQVILSRSKFSPVQLTVAPNGVGTFTKVSWPFIPPWLRPVKYG